MKSLALFKEGTQYVIISLMSFSYVNLSSSNMATFKNYALVFPRLKRKESGIWVIHSNAA